MKKLLVIMVSLVIVLSASAQRKFGGGHYYHPRTRVVIGYGGFYPYYRPFPYDPYWGYPDYFDRPTRLELKIEDIRADYQDKIWSVRHDKSLSRSDRRRQIHDLKSERDEAIRDAERDYHGTY